MTVRDMVKARKAEMLDELPPSRARQLLVEFTALYGNCQTAVREAEGAYHEDLLRHLDSGEPANRAKIRAQTGDAYKALREATDTLRLVLESIRSLKAMLRSIDEEMRMAR